MKILITVVVVVLLVLGGIWGVAGWLRSRMDKAKEPTAVRVEPAARGPLIEVVSAPGIVQPRTKVNISARISARITELPFVEGQRVSRGNPQTLPPLPPSVLVRLDSKELEADLRSEQARYAAQETEIAVAQARISAQEAQIESRRISLADADRELKRQKQLAEQGDVSKVALEQAQTKVDSLQAQLDADLRGLKAEQISLQVRQHNLRSTEADIEKKREALKYTVIESPIDGLVTRLNAKVGELVVTGTMNNAGTVIMEVADLSQMLLLARVDEMAIAAVKPGQKALVRMQAYPDEVFEGVVETVALANTDEKDGTKYYKTEILLKTGNRQIFSGLTADVDIQTHNHQNVIRVPSQAVLSRPVDDLPAEIRERPEVDKTKTTATVVYRFIDSKAVVTPVTIGPSDMTHTIIRSGLAEADLVITGPYKVLESITHDTPVKDSRPTTQPAPTTQVVQR